MWYPAKIMTAAEAEPVTLAEAKRHVHAEDFTDDDDTIAGLTATARNHVEKYCDAYWATQTVEVKADGWRDFRHLSVGPVQSVTSIVYVDSHGESQTLADTVYELRNDAVVLKYGQNWPAIQPRSLLTLTVVVGTDETPPAVKQAMLLRIGDLYETRESGDDSKWTTFDSLLANFRR